MADSLHIRTVVSDAFAENCYILWQEGSTTCVVIDPGLNPERIFKTLEDEGLTPATILNTHGHGDHIAGNTSLKERFPAAPLIIGVDEVPLLSDPWLNASALFGFSLTSPPADRTVREGDVVEAAGLRFEVIDLPGHSQGHVVYVIRGTPSLVFGGDVLMRGGVGRSDFPGGNWERLLAGIRGKLFTMPPETVVYPGHGPVTTVGHEQQNNPVVGR